MASALVAGLLSLVRQKLVARYFGAGGATAAYVGAFQLPDMLMYLLVGGVGATAFVTILSRYRERGDDAEGEHALSVILNTVLAVLVCAVVLGEVLAPQYVALALPGFRAHPDQAALCVHLTRILLPGPLFFFAGGVFSSHLLVRKIFLYQALTPILYSGGIVAGAVLLHARFGIDSLAIGAMAGAAIGSFGINVLGARREGMRYRLVWSPRHPALREWLRLNLPLMLGASLVTTDSWIRAYFASGAADSMAQLNFARQLFAAPMNILGPAAGAASLPFFASLWARGDVAAFSEAVDRSVSRMIAVSLLVAGWMIALAPLLVDVTLRGEAFTAADAAATAWYFALFALALFLWTSQNLYARAFYGAGNTLTPMLSGTAVTLLSIPMYGILFHRMGPVGLVWAANIGIAAHTLALAVLLHRKRMVSVAGLEFGELGRSLAAALGGGAAIVGLRHVLPVPATHTASLLQIAACSVLWAGVVLGVLLALRSRLPQALLRR